MSHTSVYNKTTFIHNSDLSGNVNIVNENGESWINGDDMINFVLDFLRQEKISKLDSMNYDELKNKIIYEL